MQKNITGREESVKCNYDISRDYQIGIKEMEKREFLLYRDSINVETNFNLMIFFILKHYSFNKKRMKEILKLFFGTSKIKINIENLIVLKDIFRLIKRENINF